MYITLQSRSLGRTIFESSHIDPNHATPEEKLVAWKEVLDFVTGMRDVQRAVLSHVGVAENIARMVVEMLQ